ncbi:MAG TPA: aldo/keto reductase [Bacteroidales bacterium]|nr:aldo/keto reductase [Bacteroidales bacterium]
MKRREFIRTAAIAAPALQLFPSGLSGITREKMPLKLEKRSLGRTGEKLSILGFGGIVVMNATPGESDQRVKQAIDYGVNYFDVAPTYGDAELKLGPALKPYRKDVFLACKTQERTREGARRELEASLERLQTDHFDLYQHHAVREMKDVDTIFAPGGAMEAFIKAREEGLVRFLGFSAHSVEAAMALMERYDFDTILFPVNFATWYAGHFGPQVLEKARQKDMGILALKAMARRPWPEGAKRTNNKTWYEPLNTPAEAQMGLRFTLSHPVTAAIPPGHEDLFRMALDLATRFDPLNENEVLAIKQKGLKGQPLFSYPMD